MDRSITPDPPSGAQERHSKIMESDENLWVSVLGARIQLPLFSFLKMYIFDTRCVFFALCFILFFLCFKCLLLCPIMSHYGCDTCIPWNKLIIIQIILISKANNEFNKDGILHVWLATECLFIVSLLIKNWVKCSCMWNASMDGWQQ